MAKLTKKLNVGASSLSASLLAIIDPIRTALDSNVSRDDIDNHREGGAMDAGHAIPSMEDAGLRILLDSLARQIYRQLKGTINAKNGTRYDNLTDRFNKSQDDMAAHADKYRDDMTGLQADPRTYVLLHWSGVNEARYNAYTEMLNEISDVYCEVTGKAWVYVEDTRTQPVAAKDMTDAQRAAALAKFTNIRRTANA